MDRTTQSTRQRFGYLHAQSAVPPQVTPVKYHLAVMQAAVDAPPFRGCVLDAGCGDGVDLATVGLTEGCIAVGVELSDGGIGTSAARTHAIPGAHVVQGDLCKLPFPAGSFDGAYSYGVLHHTVDPERATREIANTLKPGAPFLFYLYEDFSDRSLQWRVGLAAVSAVRSLTTRMPPAVLMGLCRIAAPLVYATCTWPSRHFRWASRFPYRHCRTIRSVAPDLYDRMAAPVEYRYSREAAAALATSAGLTVKRVAQARGWVVLAEKPA
jgi:SAM-dependent methyltransferase